MIRQNMYKLNGRKTDIDQIYKGRDYQQEPLEIIVWILKVNYCVSYLNNLNKGQICIISIFCYGSNKIYAKKTKQLSQYVLIPV